uniref:Uncharacterized protein n=1 Tax=viral metagenome TaxID=1070528 RepID=A0A6M3M063_9ZZZZ
MSKNLEIKTKTFKLSAAALAGRHAVIGSSVAAGMKRYVTFVKVAAWKPEGAISGASKVYFTSTAGVASATAVPSATGAASTAAKLSIFIQSGIVVTTQPVSISKNRMVPEIPDTKNPLFTIAASRWLSAYLCSVAPQNHPVEVMVQYFDE